MGRARFVDETAHSKQSAVADGESQRTARQKEKLSALNLVKTRQKLAEASCLDSYANKAAYLVASEPFDLLHRGHFDAFDVAADAVLRSEGAAVVGAFVAPWPEEETCSAGGIEVFLQPLQHRVAMCEAACNNHAWADVCPWGWSAAPRLTDRINQQLGKMAGSIGSAGPCEIVGWHVARSAAHLLWLLKQQCRPVVCVGQGQDAILQQALQAKQNLGGSATSHSPAATYRKRAFTRRIGILCSARTLPEASQTSRQLRELLTARRWSDALASGLLHQDVVEKFKALAEAAEGDLKGQEAATDASLPEATNRQEEEKEPPSQEAGKIQPTPSKELAWGTGSGCAQYTTGNAAKASQSGGRKIIAHACNDQGNGGRGFFQELQSEWGNAASRAYFEWHRDRASSGFRLGAVQFIAVSRLVEVANMICQQGSKSGSRGPPVRYDAVEEVLSAVGERAASMGASVHMPRIGCGRHGGGDWGRIWNLVKAMAKKYNIDVYLYGQ
mmetsp:Transcript_47935/g.113945  ORF Transcript_47935/g.113945 Transcript_47935/m.113945 type:complete len:500 (-) Transcript_47935:69-1568(-)